MNNPIILALLTSIFFGIAGPVAKLASNKGMHSDGFAFAYASGLFVFVAITSFQKGVGALFPTGSLYLGILAGMCCAIGFKFNAMAFSIPGSLVSVVVVLVATYPLISTAISLPLLGEASRVVVPKIVIGSLMAIGGAYLVATSIK